MMFRALWVGFLFSVGGACLWGDPLPGHFTINYNTPLGCLAGQEGCAVDSGWVNPSDPNGRTFTLDFNVPLLPQEGGLDTTQFVNCLGCADPDMEVDLGGQSAPITEHNTPFFLNDCTNGVCDFQNDTGVAWTDLFISTTLDGFTANAAFLCSGGTAFANCGYFEDTQTNTLEALFWGTDTTHPGIVAAPEPASWSLLLAGMAACVIVTRRRKAARARA